MSYAPKVVLKLPLSSNAALEAFVEGCLRDKGELLALWGDEAPSIEDEIDWFIVSDGGVGERFIIPTAHLPKDNSFDWVVTLATQFGESKAQAQVVEL
jgi:hypothetical protein